MLGELSEQEFLERYWQRSPLVLRGAAAGFRSPISSDELAGLACEEDVESRLVQGRWGGTWTLEHGPFAEDRFERLPKRDWTLLVQDVDKFVPEIAALLQPFRFIPDWRIDDVMVSFAAPGGSVGPHTDQYDVFLLQAKGRRRWQWSEKFDPALVPDADLKLLAEFVPEQEFVAEPGDILYLPPNVAHFGVAVGEAMTFSIGFRAPDQRELVLAFADELADHASSERRFGDAGRAVTRAPQLLGEPDLAQFRRLLRDALGRTDAELDDFVGRYLTRNKPNLVASGTVTTGARIATRLARGRRLSRRLGSRWALTADAASPCLFVDGERYVLTAQDLVVLDPLLQGMPLALAERPSEAALGLLAVWLESGAIEWDDPKAASER